MKRRHYVGLIDLVRIGTNGSIQLGINALVAVMMIFTASSDLSSQSRNADAVVPSVVFADVTEQSGITFVHENGAVGDKWYPEIFGGGVVVLDVDSDGWSDLLFINSGDWSPGDVASSHGLYRNNGDGSFIDIVSGSGFDTSAFYGLGGTVADYDNDGRDDVFVTTADGGRLFHNEGNNRFVDVTESSGITNPHFAVSAAWLDYDLDGLVDLFIGNYVAWSPELEVPCSEQGVRGYCGPDAYAPLPPALYRNVGNGRFEDVTASAGLDAPTDKAMGVVVFDYNQDGWPDLFVGSDRVPAKLYRNTGNGGFVDQGLQAGVALSELGIARGNMGADAADYDRSGKPDLVVGNFSYEMLGLYHNEDGRTFVDRAPRSEVGRSSYLSTTWAVFFLDYDLDGFPDIFAANGANDESQVMRDSRLQITQVPLLLWNRGNGTFANVTTGLGESFNQPIMGRGAAYTDFDGDGDLDIIVATLAGRPRLFRNDGGNQHNWLRVRLSGSPSNRSGLGAVVRVTSESGVQWQTVHSGSSYASQSELTLTFGLATDAQVLRLEVDWPSGVLQTFEDVGRNQVVVIDEVEGLASGP